MRELKQFLALRDARAEFAPAKAGGSVGIPAILSPDGALTLDWEGYLALLGLHVVYKENAPACSLDGKGC